jgi:hypothetical protein
MQTSKALWWCGAIVLAAGCATATAFNSTWRNPEIGAVKLDGQKVVVLVLSTQETTRRGAEDTVAAQITARGAQGVAAWTILPTADMQNEEKARAAFAKAGAAAVVTMEVVAQDRDSRDRRPPNLSLSMSTGRSRSFWSNYHWGWQNTWHSGPPPTTNVWVETLVHTLQPDELLWGGRSETVNPSAISTVFSEVAKAAAREIEKAGLLKGPA